MKKALFSAAPGGHSSLAPRRPAPAYNDRRPGRDDVLQRVPWSVNLSRKLNGVDAGTVGERQAAV